MALAIFLAAAAGRSTSADAGQTPVWFRLQVIENTAEGQAADRCEVAGILPGNPAQRWRVFYGEVRADAGAGWSAIRARSGCAPVTSESDSGPWILRGSPYLLVDIGLAAHPAPNREIALDVSLAIRKLTGFAKDGKPEYQRSTEKRMVHLADGGSAVVPVLLANDREREELRFRELLFRIRAADFDSRPRAEYGEIAVTADVPWATILLDGGPVGYTPFEGPVVLPHVRTGERRVAVRDASGRTASAVARVAKGQRSDVTLRLLADADTSGAEQGGRAARGPVAGGTPALPEALRAVGRNRQGGEEFWRARDGAIVARIPEGDLQMGSPDGQGEAAEHPRHVVRVDAFLMDKMEVTWGQYRRFAAETGRPSGKVPIWGMREEFPASAVLWEDARAFCAWAGGRLPTEAEWERAARGDDTRAYPWGDEWDPSRCNTRDGGPHAPTAVGSLPDCVSPYGVLDLTGNVWEWCADWFDAAFYEKSPAENPQGPANGDTRVSRGGCFMSPSFTARATSRQGTDPGWPDTLRGFRCAMDEPEVPSGARPSTGSGRAERTASRSEALQPTAVQTPNGTAGPKAADLGGRRAAGAPGAPTTAISVEVVLQSSDAARAQRCEVIQTPLGGPALAWGAFGAARPKADGGLEVSASDRCGPGVFPQATDPATPSNAVPFLIIGVSATPMMDPGAMDPGPARVIQLAATVTARQLTAFSPEGRPIYGESAPDHRLARITADGELVVPVPVADLAAGRDAIGRQVLVRLRATRIGEPGATEYGSVLVVGAAPNSEILLDGGAVSRAGTDGVAALASIATGIHTITLEAGPGRTVERAIEVVRDRTVVASAREASDAATLTPSGKNALGFSELRRSRDGAVMVQIPAGEFVMGNLETENKPPPHPVRLSTFLMDKVAVTWGSFKEFAGSTGSPLPPTPYWGIHDDHPVVFVSWDEARAYCEWAGARLPTEAEREKAARGTDGRLFPWGNEEPSPERGVFRHNWGYEATAPVGQRPAGASPYGILDAGGNVWEWCEDWYDPDYYRSSPVQDPTGPRTGRARIVRGGSWDSRPTVLSASCRNWGYTGYREGDFGFRCAADVPR